MLEDLHVVQVRESNHTCVCAKYCECVAEMSQRATCCTVRRLRASEETRKLIVASCGVSRPKIARKYAYQLATMLVQKSGRRRQCSCNVRTLCSDLLPDRCSINMRRTLEISSFYYFRCEWCYLEGHTRYYHRELELRADL